MPWNTRITSDDIPDNGWPVHGEDWATLTSSTEPAKFAEAWLARQSIILGDVLLKAVVVFSAGRGSSFTPIAVWPQGSMGSPGLVAAIEKTIKNRKAEIRTGAHASSDGSGRQEFDVISYPIVVNGNICGAAAFELKHQSAEALKGSVARLRWASAWLEVLVHRNKESSADKLITALNAVATIIDHERFQAAATAIATELAGKLRCDRLSISFLKGQHAKLAALSHSASFDGKASLIRAIEAAMDEAIDQQSTIIYPVADSDPLRVIRAHEELQAQHKVGAICTIPLAQGDEILGAITLERPEEEPFDQSTVQLCEQIAALLGPVLELKRKDDRLLLSKASDSFRSYIRKLVGPRHPGLKISTAAVVLLLAFFSFANGDYRVTANARLEGLVQRAVSAPMDGYISEAVVRAGDTVKAGELMFSLDDRDLWLERLKWNSQRSQFSREYSDALAKHERARASVLSAQIDQADAQIALIEEQLSRIKVTSPFDSYVVSGDLSQSLGAPVGRGDILFEVTPLDAYRVVLDVEERDIGEMQVGQTGNLVVAGMPADRIPFVVEKVTPVANASEGINAFRVEATLVSDDLPLLRPGMEGYGKVDIERRRLIWIWTHKITYWLRMFFWSWWP